MVYLLHKSVTHFTTWWEKKIYMVFPWNLCRPGLQQPERHEQHHLSCGESAVPLKPILPASPVRLLIAHQICETALSYCSKADMQASGRQMGRSARKRGTCTATCCAVCVCLWCGQSAYLHLLFSVLCMRSVGENLVFTDWSSANYVVTMSWNCSPLSWERLDTQHLNVYICVWGFFLIYLALLWHPVMLLSVLLPLFDLILSERRNQKMSLAVISVTQQLVAR